MAPCQTRRNRECINIRKTEGKKCINIRRAEGKKKNRINKTRKRTVGVRTQRLNHFETFILSNRHFHQSIGGINRRGKERESASVCTYLLCGHTCRLLQPKLPPHSDLRGTAAPQADGPKYMSSERGHKREITHLSKLGTSQSGQRERGKVGGNKPFTCHNGVYWFHHKCPFNFSYQTSCKQPMGLLYIRELTLRLAWNPEQH